MVHYKVKALAFINGRLCKVGETVEGPDGLDGNALERIGGPSPATANSGAPDRGTANDDAAKLAELEAEVAKLAAVVTSKSAECDDLHKIVASLKEERSVRAKALDDANTKLLQAAAKVDDLERRLADAQKAMPQQKK